MTSATDLTATRKMGDRPNREEEEEEEEEEKEEGEVEGVAV
jgi:hypothetical protein